MAVLLIVACALLGLAAFCFFGAPYLIFGRGALAGVVSRPEAKTAAGVLATGAIAVVMAPLGWMALISSGEQAQVFAAHISGLSFGM